MYNEVDSARILAMLEAREGREAGFRELEQTLLEFQLEGHKKFLARFNDLFREHDRDQDGALSLGEFLRIVRQIDPQLRDS